jgi:hypothetical protein
MAKAAKMQGNNTPCKTLVPKPPTSGTPRAPTAQKGTYVSSTSTQPSADQKVDNKLKGTAAKEDMEIPADPNNPDKKLQINLNLDPK